MTEKDARRKMYQLPLSTLRQEFIMNFMTNRLCHELMEEVAPSRLKRFIIDRFIKEFSLEEISGMLNKISERR